MAWREGICGVLLDVDGTLLVDDEPVPGAAEALDRLRAARVVVRVTTNTTRRSRSAIATVLQRAGIEVAVSEILTPAALARQRILRSGRTRAALFIPEEARRDFEGVEDVGVDPHWVVMGDMGRGTTWERLNAAFRFVLSGAALLALHKNRYWHAGEDGWVLDAGAFVSAIEYATGARAEVVGKPSPEFFRLAIDDLALPAEAVLVVGDDPETDGAGGRAAGCRIAIVKTGKFRGAPSEIETLRPELVVDSVADLLS